jgi:cell division protein ZapA
VGKVDEAMCKIRDAGKIKARDRIAVLAALNLAFDLTDRPAAVQASGDSTTSSTDLHNLLQRMDAVLARDNQLI